MLEFSATDETQIKHGYKKGTVYKEGRKARKGSERFNHGWTQINTDVKRQIRNALKSGRRRERKDVDGFFGRTFTSYFDYGLARVRFEH
jgi:hypothetical protein